VKHLVAPFPFLKLHLALESYEMDSLSEIPPEHILHLQILRIGCYNSHWYGRSNRRSHIFPMKTITFRLPPQLPYLVDLTFCDCFGEHLEKLITTVPWQNLMELFLQFDIPSTTCLNVILRRGTSLVRCALKPTSDAMFSRLPDTEPSVILPRMDILALHCSSYADAVRFKRLVLTPAASTRHIGTHAYYGVDAYRPSLTLRTSLCN
jgi:hypothetical protein